MANTHMSHKSESAFELSTCQRQLFCNSSAMMNLSQLTPHVPSIWKPISPGFKFSPWNGFCLHLTLVLGFPPTVCLHNKHRRQNTWPAIVNA